MKAKKVGRPFNAQQPNVSNDISTFEGKELFEDEMLHSETLLNDISL